MPTEMVSKEIKSFAEFASAIGQGKRRGLIFRGQPCDKPLLPKLGRPDIALKGKKRLADVERELFEEFQRTSLPLREIGTDGEWELLALAQHHGLPTRLLDWTYSAMAAIWFAVRPSQANDGMDGVIWVLAPERSDFRSDSSGKPFDNKSRTLVFRPKAISRRIVAQDGLFTVHKMLNEDRFVALDSNSRYKEKLSKFVIPHDRFETVRREVGVFGANDSLYFPDLDGLCNYLRWRITSFAAQGVATHTHRPR